MPESRSPRTTGKSASRLSLYGMKPEDALRRALSTPPPPKTKKPAKGKKKG